ncbi:MAG: sensor domain-containing diguanylate cyclase [bacterium]
MIGMEEKINRFMSLLSQARLQDMDIKEVVRLLGTSVASRGCLLVFNNRIVFRYKVSEEFSLRISLNERKNRVFCEELEISGLKYQLYLLFDKDESLDEVQVQKLRNILKIVAQSLSVSSVAKVRISEFQVINELNLNVITTMEVKKVIWFAESAAQRLLDTKEVFLFYLIEDRLIGQQDNFSIKVLPEEVFRLLTRSRQVVTLNKKENKFLKVLLKHLGSGVALFVPFTIKNQVRGFFILDEYDKISDQTSAIMRLKFLGNQAAIALERIELFQALSKALQESRGLQEIAKLLLSPYELKYFFNELLRRAQQILGFRKIMCSIYDPLTDSFERMHGVGISTKKLREARKVHPPYKLIKSLMQDRFRISNSYYVPSEEVFSEIREYEVYKSTPEQKRVYNLWSPGDLLISPIYSKGGEILGILSLAEPMNNRVPDRSKIRLLEAFGDFLGLAIENNQLFEKNVFLSYTDDLTGVYNYRFLKEKLNELIKKEPKSLAIAMIDLDRFKEYNDQFGHLAGDLMLKKVSQILKDVVKNGYVTRYGGDEFIIILPDAGPRSVQYRINKAKQMIASSKHNNISVQFSCGIAMYPGDGKDFGTLIDCADKRLYQEKRKKYDTIA